MAITARGTAFGCVMDPTFGVRLRAQREERHISLSKISEDTKIKLSMLEGLEGDDVSQWPEGIFRRAYVRAYARAIGLDPEPLVREFLEVHPDPLPPQTETSTELEEPQWPAGFRRLVTSAMAAVPSRRQRTSNDSPLDPAGAPSALETPAIAETQQEFRRKLSLTQAAELCTRLGRVMHKRDVAAILEDAALALDAVGLILWAWDSRTASLRPIFAYGYADAAVARMPKVRTDANNAIATAFQSRQPCIVDRGDEVTGAIAVPMMAPAGCGGVLALELKNGDERREDLLAFAAILAAQLVATLGSAPLAEAVNA
jgi:transcriptional regulator with XRE-family HTH domain